MKYYGQDYYLVTGGIENNQPIGKTYFYSKSRSGPGFDLKVPRYYHACGVYNDPAENIDVNIQLIPFYYSLDC